MAAYVLFGLLIAILELFGIGLLRNSGEEPATQLVVETRSQERESETVRTTSQKTAPEPVAEVESSIRDRVIVGETVDELRLVNDVRPLMYEEQSVDLSRLRTLAKIDH